MNKSNLCFLLAGISLATMLSGCGKSETSELTNATNITNATNTESASSQQESSEANTTTSDINAAISPENAVDTAKHYLPAILSSSSFSTLDYIDENGSIVKSIDENQFIDDYHTSICYAYDNKLVLSSYEYDNNTFITKYFYSVLNIDTMQSTDLCSLNDYAFVDVFEGKLYIVPKNNETGEYLEFIYDADTLAPLGADGKNAYDDIYGYSLATNTQNTYHDCKPCMQRLLSEIGFAIIRDDNAAYDENPYSIYNGTDISKLDIFSSDDYVLAYNSEKIILYSLNMDNWQSSLFISDYNGNRTLLSENYRMFCGLFGDLIYWTDEVLPATLPETFSIFYYNIATEQSGSLGEFTQHPGIGNYTPGILDINISGDALYYLSDDGENVQWYRASFEGENLVTDVLDRIVFTPEYAEYAIAKSLSESKLCKFCEQPIYLYYSEYLEFKPGLFKDTDAINKLLRDTETDKMNMAIQAPMYEENDSSNCEYHGQYYSLETYSSTIGSLEFIGSSHVAINNSNYWYGGGAHGMPSSSQYFINLSNNNIEKFSDLYMGTEDDLKNIVATAVADYFDACEYGDGDYYFYDGQTHEAIFAEAYEMTSIDTLDVRFTANGLFVDFPPYIFGPFASGTLSVNIDYSTLGITIG